MSPSPPTGAVAFGSRDVDAAAKPGLVKGVFDSVAGRYDLMNDLMSGGVHRLWKDAAAARLNPQPGETIVDCAGGTGDMARRFSRLMRAARMRRGGGPGGQVVVVDYTEAMVRAGRESPWDDEVLWTVGDAQGLPLPTASANGYCIAFGLRNVTDIAAALAEARRVLRPGGRFLCLEFSRPTTGALARLYDAYSNQVIPRLGRAVAGDRQAYDYLVESIRRFPSQKALASLMAQAGLARVTFTNFSGGVCALHQGWAI
jgi:demethylmenaquinone methyltransferase/2-methoxy-6-polyprenyl-1,4-benzoquinol methylase